MKYHNDSWLAFRSSALLSISAHVPGLIQALSGNSLLVGRTHSPWRSSNSDSPKVGGLAIGVRSGFRSIFLF